MQPAAQILDAAKADLAGLVAVVAQRPPRAAAAAVDPARGEVDRAEHGDRRLGRHGGRQGPRRQGSQGRLGDSSRQRRRLSPHGMTQGDPPSASDVPIRHRLAGVHRHVGCCGVLLPQRRDRRLGERTMQNRRRRTDDAEASAMPNPLNPSPDPQRRLLLKGSLSLPLAGLWSCSVYAATSAAPPIRLYFAPDERSFVEAATERLIPDGSDGLGARSAAVAFFIDRQLAGPYGRAETWYMQGPWSSGNEQQGFQSKLDTGRDLPRRHRRDRRALQAKLCRQGVRGAGRQRPGRGAAQARERRLAASRS